MANHYNALTIVLEEDLHEDDAKALIDAIQMMRGVLTVTPNVRDIASAVSDARAKQELTLKLLEVLRGSDKR